MAVWQSIQTEQKAIIVEYDPSRMTADEAVIALNDFLRNGWRIASMHPMGGGFSAGHETPRFASLVVLNREMKDATA